MAIEKQFGAHEIQNVLVHTVMTNKATMKADAQWKIDEEMKDERIQTAVQS